jgi:hypothetical protein
LGATSIRTGEDKTKGFYGVFVDLAILLEFGKVVDEGEVYDAIGVGRAAAQALWR